MFAVDDIVIYGNTGVCKVLKVDTLDMNGVDKSRLYYYLKPLFATGTIYAPVDAKTFMRHIITKEEVDKTIALIPQIKATPVIERNIQTLAEEYNKSFESHDCIDLIRLVMSIYTKKNLLESGGKKFGQTDERFMKRAEDLLYSEFAVVLDIPKEKVEEYIATKLDEMQK
ncbi:MAG: CarD family transcriptional regulator [Oscillospiraceae bacterium]|nr:CarD family transcriptional regulator [Oscillospiraceae bacterium]